ncbi:hypothetical protein M5D96_002431, partial [Drosophila gunungcola]
AGQVGPSQESQAEAVLRLGFFSCICNFVYGRAHLMSCIGIGKCFHSCSSCCFCCCCCCCRFCCTCECCSCAQLGGVPGFCGAGPAPTTRLIGNA